MNTEARTRIEDHRLMRTQEAVQDVARTKQHDALLRERARVERARRTRRAWVHAGAFVLAYIFAAGVALIGILLWARADDLFAFLIVALFASLAFIACFAGVRVLVLHKLMDEYPNKEEDPGMEHHVSKSIAYGFVALVGALMCTALLVKIASAFS